MRGNFSLNSLSSFALLPRTRFSHTLSLSSKLLQITSHWSWLATAVFDSRSSSILKESHSFLCFLALHVPLVSVARLRHLRRFTLVELAPNSKRPLLKLTTRDADFARSFPRRMVTSPASEHTLKAGSESTRTLKSSESPAQGGKAPKEAVKSAPASSQKSKRKAKKHES